MSRTDVHRPMHALILDPTIRHWFRVDHDHRRGPCDLAEFYAALIAGQSWRTRCGIWPGPRCANLCACDLCGCQWQRRQDRRRQRASALRGCREARKVADRGDVDIWQRRGTSW